LSAQKKTIHEKEDSTHREKVQRTPGKFARTTTRQSVYPQAPAAPRPKHGGGAP